MHIHKLLRAMEAVVGQNESGRAFLAEFKELCVPATVSWEPMPRMRELSREKFRESIWYAAERWSLISAYELHADPYEFYCRHRKEHNRHYAQAKTAIISIPGRIGDRILPVLPIQQQDLFAAVIPEAREAPSPERMVTRRILPCRVEGKFRYCNILVTSPDLCHQDWLGYACCLEGAILLSELKRLGSLDALCAVEGYHGERLSVAEFRNMQTKLDEDQWDDIYAAVGLLRDLSPGIAACEDAIIERLNRHKRPLNEVIRRVNAVTLLLSEHWEEVAGSLSPAERELRMSLAYLMALHRFGGREHFNSRTSPYLTSSL